MSTSKAVKAVENFDDVAVRRREEGSVNGRERTGTGTRNSILDRGQSNKI